MNQRNRFFIFLGVLFVLAAVYYFLTSNHSSDLVLIGTVDANQVVVSPKIAGRIERLAVDEGTEVKAGDLIAILDSAEIEAQKRAAEATAQGLKATVGASRATEASTAGETTSAVANARARLQSANAALAEAKAQLVRVQQDRDRIVPLAEQGVASAQDRDRAEADLSAAKAHVAALEEQARAAQADIAAAQARTNQARAAQSNVSASREQAHSAQAQLAEIETRLGYTRVVAPISGTISLRVAREGEVVNVGSPIVTIVDLSDTWVRASVPETQATNISIGQTLRVKLPDGSITQGKVITKAAEGDFATQRDVGRSKRDIKTVGLRLQVENAKKTLVPGMTAEVLISPDELAGKRSEAKR